MSDNLTGLKAVVNLMADATVDTIKALAPGENPISKLVNYKNLFPDLASLFENISSIPAEVKDLNPEEYLLLVEDLVARLAISNPEAEAIVQACIKLINDSIAVLIPDTNAVIEAIKSFKK